MEQSPAAAGSSNRKVLVRLAGIVAIILFGVTVTVVLLRAADAPSQQELDDLEQQLNDVRRDSRELAECVMARFEGRSRPACGLSGLWFTPPPE